MAVGLGFCHRIGRNIQMFEPVTVRTEDDTAVDFVADAGLRVAVYNHCGDTLIFVSRVVKIQTARSIFVTSTTFAVTVLVLEQPSTDLQSTSVLPVDSCLPVLVIPPLLACDLRPVEVGGKFDIVRLRSNVCVTGCTPVERLQSSPFFRYVPATQCLHNRR
jgi:hypothetical protein